MRSRTNTIDSCIIKNNININNKMPPSYREGKSSTISFLEKILLLSTICCIKSKKKKEIKKKGEKQRRKKYILKKKVSVHFANKKSFKTTGTVVPFKTLSVSIPKFQTMFFFTVFVPKKKKKINIINT